MHERGFKRGLGVACAVALTALAAGCAGLGESVGRTGTAAGAPSVDRLLADLSQNDARIQSFRSGGSFQIESPDLEAIQRFRGFIVFRRPASLYVQGNHRITNIPIFKLACAGPEFVMEFPGSRDQSFYQTEAEQFDDVPFSVSPSDIAREMFLPEEWSALKRRDARVVGYDDATQTVSMTIGPANAPRRVVELIRVDEADPRWVPHRVVRLREDGGVLAITTLDEYTNVDGALFPTKVDAHFPTESTRMTFSMSRVRLNLDVPDEYFQVRERARELNLEARTAVSHTSSGR